ncbi:MAG: hypothetical protein IRY91_02620 [Gemmatimonadaceae bacterium]|nr:hypothetical protein [Gemmatimonadaceae bacterium]
MLDTQRSARRPVRLPPPSTRGALLCAVLVLAPRCVESKAKTTLHTAKALVASAQSAFAEPRSRRFAAPADTSPKSVEAALWTGHSAISPHFQHATFAYTDFYYSYYSRATMPLLAKRYDYIMSGSGSRWRALDATISHIPYRLLWTVPLPGQKSNEFATMEAWYAAHPQFDIEDAFLHEVGTSRDPAHRMTTVIWGTKRWMLNPADSGLRLYHRDDLGRILESGDAGVFYDELGRGVMAKAFRSLELDSLAYQRATVAKLAAEREAYPHAIIKVNTAAYMTPFDSAVIVAAGAAHLETLNDALSANITYAWRWIDNLFAAGVWSIEFVSLRAWTDKLPASLTPGNEDTRIHRVRMGDYASYLMVRPSAPRKLQWNQDNSWSEDPGAHWLKAYEANLGEPMAARSVLTSGTDPLGQKYTVWQRPYTRATVLLRTVVGWDKPNYGDESAITVTLPRPMRRLTSSGALASPSTTITLRAGEGAILLP